MVDVQSVKVGSQVDNSLLFSDLALDINGDKSDATHRIDDRPLVNQFNN